MESRFADFIRILGEEHRRESENLRMYTQKSFFGNQGKSEKEELSVRDFSCRIPILPHDISGIQKYVRNRLDSLRDFQIITDIRENPHREHG